MSVDRITKCIIYRKVVVEEVHYKTLYVHIIKYIGFYGQPNWTKKVTINFGDVGGILNKKLKELCDKKMNKAIKME